MNYPDNLPAPNIGATSQIENNTIFTTLGRGQPTYKLSSEPQTNLLTLVFVYSSEEFKIFKKFFKEDLNNGLDVFTIEFSGKLFRGRITNGTYLAQPHTNDLSYWQVSLLFRADFVVLTTGLEVICSIGEDEFEDLLRCEHDLENALLSMPLPFQDS